MNGNWIILLLLMLLEDIRTEKSSEEIEIENLPLTKTLGYAIRKNFGNNLDDARLNQEYLYQYHEMMKASQESFESFEDQGGRKQRRSKGEGVPDRHRSVHQSAVGSRRARSQELRRRKLNSQGHRSHQKYSKKSSSEFYTD